VGEFLAAVEQEDFFHGRVSRGVNNVCRQAIDIGPSE